MRKTGPNFINLLIIFLKNKPFTSSASLSLFFFSLSLLVVCFVRNDVRSRRRQVVCVQKDAHEHTRDRLAFLSRGRRTAARVDVRETVTRCAVSAP